MPFHSPSPADSVKECFLTETSTGGEWSEALEHPRASYAHVSSYEGPDHKTFGDLCYTTSKCDKTLNCHNNILKETIHTEEKPFTCDSCDRTSSSSNNCRRHSDEGGGVKLLAQRLSRSDTSVVMSTIKHKITSVVEALRGTLSPVASVTGCPQRTAGEKIHIGEKPYTCDPCDRMFSSGGSTHPDEGGWRFFGQGVSRMARGPSLATNAERRLQMDSITGGERFPAQRVSRLEGNPTSATSLTGCFWTGTTAEGEWSEALACPLIPNGPATRMMGCTAGNHRKRVPCSKRVKTGGTLSPAYAQSWECSENEVPMERKDYSWHAHSSQLGGNLCKTDLRLCTRRDPGCQRKGP